MEFDLINLIFPPFESNLGQKKKPVVFLLLQGVNSRSDTGACCSGASVIPVPRAQSACWGLFALTSFQYGMPLSSSDGPRLHVHSLAEARTSAGGLFGDKQRDGDGCCQRVGRVC